MGRPLCSCDVPAWPNVLRTHTHTHTLTKKERCSQRHRKSQQAQKRAGSVHDKEELRVREGRREKRQSGGQARVSDKTKCRWRHPQQVSVNGKSCTKQNKNNKRGGSGGRGEGGGAVRSVEMSVQTRTNRGSFEAHARVFDTPSGKA